MSRQNTVRWNIGLIAASFLLAPGWVSAAAAETPRLVLQITVDALRGDLPERYAHLFGASSLESEDYLARLDRTLAALFRHVDDKVGLENTLIVLSADHGQPEIPGHLRELGIEHARHFDTDALDKTPAIAALKARFGIAEGLIEAFFQPYVYLNRDLIRAKGLDQAEVERAVAEELVKFDGAGRKAETVSYRVTPYDVAPTLANVLGVKPPSGAIGNPLAEVVGN